MVYPALLLTIKAYAHNSAASSRLNWPPTSPLADSNGLVRFAERWNLFFARVPPRFNLPLTKYSDTWNKEFDLFDAVTYSASLYWHVRSCTILSICNCNTPRAKAQTCLTPKTYVITELGGGLRWRKIKLRAIRWLTEDRFGLSPLFRPSPKASYNGFINERLTVNIALQEMNLMRLLNNEAAQ
jgi:hypothetical protein